MSESSSESDFVILQLSGEEMHFVLGPAARRDEAKEDVLQIFRWPTFF